VSFRIRNGPAELAETEPGLQSALDSPPTGGMKPDCGLIGPHLSDTAGNVGRGIAAREFPRRESCAGGSARAKAVHRKRSPGGTIPIPGHQVPAPLPGQELVWLGDVTADGAAQAMEIELETQVVPASGSNRSENLSIHCGAVARRANCGNLQGVDPMPQSGWQQLLELDQRPQGGLGDTGDIAPGSRAQRDRYRYRLVIVEEKRR